MAEVDLNRIKLNCSLVVFYCTFFLQDKLFLVVQELFLDRVASPCDAVAFKVHLGLCEHVLISLQCALRLQKSRAERTRIDVHQRIALTNRSEERRVRK